ncbi:MAG: peptidase domain-containing ABC transporter [Deferribacteres bacterium]|nr:peptidase domain-containing ABC transporter [candidate division KSB1 bacterium]MCB9502080.1 peptidase domain-containing ABC transporter [Deferribacteres bacterium]
MRYYKKYPVVRQYDQIDCGPAAVLSILKFYGGNSSIVHIRELTQTDASGSNMLGLVKAAKKLGFQAYGATGEYEDLMTEKMPCIAHVIIDKRLQHFVIVYKIDGKGVLIGDPGKGLVKLSKEQFLTIWQRKAIVLLKPGENLFKDTPPHWFKWIWNFFKEEESWLYQTLFLGIVATTLGLLVSVFVQWLIDRFIPEKDFYKIVLTGVFVLGLQSLKAGTAYLRQHFLVELSKRVNVNVNTDFLSHIFHLPISFFKTRKKGDITARINDTIKIQMALLNFFSVSIIDGLIIFGSFILLFFLAKPLAWLALVTLPFYAVLLYFATNKIKIQQNETMKSYAQVEAFYFDSLDGIEEILSFNTSPSFIKINRLIFENFQQKAAQLGLTQAGISFIAELTSGILIVAVLGFGATLVMNDTLLLGQMMASYSLLANMLPAINRLVGANISLQGASIAVQRLFDLLLVEKEHNHGEKAFSMNDAIHIKNLQFGWPKGIQLFNDLNMSIPKGKITSLWGKSGTGKSTLAQILQRKYTVEYGSIMVDDVPIQEINLCALRKNIAVISQNIKIFNGSILENIVVGREVNDMQDLQNRISEFGLDAFFSHFQFGLHTRIGEDGQQLSGGEKQIIGLVRALLDEPQVLIVDEGINAIDAEMEYLVFATLKAYSRQHAVLLISHNLRTLAKTDTLYLLENGQIAATGKPTELLKSSKRFQKLWQIQMPAVTINGVELAYDN